MTHARGLAGEEIPEGEDRLLTAPNLITLVRLLCIPLFLWLLFGTEDYLAAAGLLADAGKTLPFIDRIVFRITEEEQPAWLLFLRGDMEMMGIPKDNFATAVDMQAQRPKDFLEQRKIQLAISDQPSLYYIGFNMQDAVLGQNKPLRQALNYAFDSEKLNDLFYRL